MRFGVFRPVMKLKTIVSMVKEMQPGQSASYGRRFTAEKPTKVATLWGGTVSDSAETIARKTDTISYEVLCGVSRRVPRVYLENGGVKAVEDWIL